MSDTLRPTRADARRNRDRILEVAFEAFAAEGLSVPVQEIARRAGVGNGTVSRHFPTKESLFEAVLLSRAAGLVEQAVRLATSDDPGAAFFEYFGVLVAEGAANLGLAQALMGAGRSAVGRGTPRRGGAARHGARHGGSRGGGFDLRGRVTGDLHRDEGDDGRL